MRSPPPPRGTSTGPRMVMRRSSPTRFTRTPRCTAHLATIRKPPAGSEDRLAAPAVTADPHRYLQVSTSDIGDGSHPRSGPLDPPRSSRMASDPAAAVRERLVELAGALRRGGVRVGTGEVEAAARALAAVD